MKDPKQSDQEVFESIPWEELRDLGDTSRRRRTWYLIAGAAAVAVLVFSVARAFSAPDPLIAEVPGLTPTTPPASPPTAEGSLPTLPPLESVSPTPAVMTEADLRASGDPWGGEDILQGWQAASYAEWFVLDFFTLDGSDRNATLARWLDYSATGEPSEALSYVDWVRALEVEPVGDGRWKTVLGMRRLVSLDGAGYSRVPTQAVEVVVDLATGTPAIVDIPRFLPLPQGSTGHWWLGESWEAPPPAVIKAARHQMVLSEAGAADGDPVVTRTGEAWRVQWAVVDAAGISWPVSLWIGPDAAPVPAGG